MYVCIWCITYKAEIAHIFDVQYNQVSIYISGPKDYLWCLLAYNSTCWPAAFLSIDYGSFSHTLYSKFLQLTGFLSPMRTGEMIHWLRAFAALPEVLEPGVQRV